MNLVGLVELCPVHEEVFVFYLNRMAVNSDHALHEWNVSIGGRLKGDDIPALDRTMRQILAYNRRVVCGKRNFIEKEVVADQNRRFHRFGWDLRGLSNVGCKHEHENDREYEAFKPLSDLALVARREGIEPYQFFEPDMWPFKNHKIFNEHVRSVLILHL